MERFTLLELHLDDASFAANVPGLGDDASFAANATGLSDDEPDDTDDEGAVVDGDGCRARRLLAVLAVLALLVVLVAVARAAAGDDELDDLTDLDEGTDV